MVTKLAYGCITFSNNYVLLTLTHCHFTAIKVSQSLIEVLFRFTYSVFQVMTFTVFFRFQEGEHQSCLMCDIARWDVATWNT